MIFEEIYGKWLVLQLNNRVNSVLGKTCKQYDEVSFKPLKKNPDEIAVVIEGGGAARSSVQGQDQNSVSLNVTLLCKKDYAKKVRGCIDLVQSEYNAKPLILTYDNEEGQTVNQTAKSVFYTPITIESNDFTTDKGTIKIVILSFTVTVIYGSTAVVSPDTFILSINGEEYEIKHISQYDRSSQPAYDTYLEKGKTRPTQNPISQSHAISFILVKVQGDEFQEDILESELDGEGYCLWGKNLVLYRIDSSTGSIKEILIKSYSVTNTYVNNSAAYNIAFAY